MYRTLCPTVVDSIFFSSTHGTFTKIDHTLGHKENLTKFKIIEIIKSMFLYHNGIKLETNNREMTKISKRLEIKHYSFK